MWSVEEIEAIPIELDFSSSGQGRCSVTAFLGVHDLDLLLWLAGGSIAHVQAMGSKVFTDKWDLSLAHLRLDNGIIASVENHWLINAASARSASPA